MALNSLRACTGLTCFFWEDLLTLLVWPSSCFSLFTRGFFSGAFILQETAGILRASMPLFFWYLVDATYDALTVDTTAFIRFFAAWMRDMALSNWSHEEMWEKNRETASLKKGYYAIFFTWITFELTLNCSCPSSACPVLHKMFCFAKCLYFGINNLSESVWHTTDVRN